jgi:protein-tyrosine sulfotransferase
MDFSNTGSVGDSRIGLISDAPIFVLGCHRSGTTLLRYIFDTHPGICCPPESKFISGLEAFIRTPQVLDGLLGMGFTKDDIKHQLKQFVVSFFELYARRCNKRRWADKTPNYYRRLWLIEELFDRQALYVLLVRHPLDSICSLEEFFGTHLYRNDPDISEVIDRYGAGRYAWAKYWLEVNEVLLAFANSALERTRLITYEALVSEPSLMVKELFEFVGEAYPEDILSKIFRAKRNSGFADTKIEKASSIYADSVGRWRTWNGKEIDAIWQIVKQLAERLGYSID